MAYEFKKLSDVNVIESISDSTNVLVEENGTIVKMAANSMIPEDVALKSDVVLAPATASVGQTIVVKAVDENGKPTEWETTDRLPTGGMPHQQLVTDADGAAKWESRTHWKEIKDYVVLDPQEVTFTMLEGDPFYIAEINAPNTPKTNDGDTYIIVYDNNTYERNVCYQEMMNGNMLGNMALFNIVVGEELFEDTGEPFLIQVADEQGLFIIAEDTLDTHIVGVTKKNHTIIHTIPNEYITFPEAIKLITEFDGKDVSTQTISNCRAVAIDLGIPDLTNPFIKWNNYYLQLNGTHLLDTNSDGVKDYGNILFTDLSGRVIKASLTTFEEPHTLTTSSVLTPINYIGEDYIMKVPGGYRRFYYQNSQWNSEDFSMAK